MRSNLKEFRKKLGLTQEEMGLLVNKRTKGQWCNIEAGKRNFSAEDIVELGIKFNLSAKELKRMMEDS